MCKTSVISWRKDCGFPFPVYEATVTGRVFSVWSFAGGDWRINLREAGRETSVGDAPDLASAQQRAVAWAAQHPVGTYTWTKVRRFGEWLDGVKPVPTIEAARRAGLLRAQEVWQRGGKIKAPEMDPVVKGLIADTKQDPQAAAALTKAWTIAYAEEAVRLTSALPLKPRDASWP
jgi:hypothetical protein